MTRAGNVIALHLLERHEARPRPVEVVRAVEGYGLEGNLHSGRDRRQVLLLERETLDALGLAPGDLREQITVDVPGITGLPEGTRLRVGDAVLEATGPCEPCTHIGDLLGKDDAPGFQADLRGRRGLLARVDRVEGDGMIRVGDPVEVL